MKRFKQNILTLMALLSAAFILPGCSDEMPLPAPDQDRIPDGITLRIPDVQGLAAASTRADVAEIVENEGDIHSLYLLAFASQKTPIIVDLLNDEDVSNSDYAESSSEGAHTTAANYSGYKTFDLTNVFKEAGKDATWKIYVVANLDEYTGLRSLADMKSAITDEDALKALPVSFFKEGAAASDGSKTQTYLLDPGQVAANGLPMACMASRMLVKTKGSNFTSAAAGVELSSSTSALLHADLSFLCAKVRYTLLFDNTEGGKSKDMFGGLSFNVKGVSASGIPQGATTLEQEVTAAGSIGLNKLPLKEYAYPDDADNYPQASAESGNDFTPLPELNGEPTLGRRAFQGTIYLPENSSAAATALGFACQTLDGATPKADLNYKMTLLPEETDGSTAIKRGQAYDIKADVTGVEELTLTGFVATQWTTDRLVYSLLPPSYLYVKETAVSVKAGEETILEYESNQDVSCDTPYYKDASGNEWPLFDFNTEEKGKIKISVSSSISANWFNDISDSDSKPKEGFDYIYVNAGNIHKKIDISTLNMEKFLTVTPNEITIDARAEVGSFNYDGMVKVEIKTNLDEVYIDTDTWHEISDQNCLWIVNEKNQAVKLFPSGNTSRITIPRSQMDNGRVTLLVKYDKLNDGAEFWKTDHLNSIIVSVDNGSTPQGPGYIYPERVDVTVLPNNDNYIIYFNDNGEDWDNCHIYVYQCLELPGTLYKLSTNNGMFTVKDGWWGASEKKTLALDNYTVGYYEKNSESDSSTGSSAALAYSFTGAVAFKGWEEPKNAELLKKAELENGWIHNGFFMFDNARTKYCSWNVNEPNHGCKDRYFMGADADFCKAHRDLLKKNADDGKDKYETCNDCTTGTGNAGWPGIKMIKVKTGNMAGWWRFELSAAATPGKALIMFSNGHSNYDGMKRYPGAGLNGYPLFNYPSRIGYFNVANGAYTSDKDATVSTNPTEEDAIPANRIFFNNKWADGTDTGWTQPHIFMWHSYGNNKTFPGEEMKWDDKLKLWYYDAQGDWGELIFSNGTSGNKNQSGNLTKSSTQNTYNAGGAFANTTSSGQSQGGGDGKKKYRLYWQYEYGENKRNWLCSWSNTSSIKFPVEATKIDTYGNWCYYEWEEDSNKTFSFSCRAAINNNYGGESAEISVSETSFKYNSATGCYENTTYQNELKPKVRKRF